MIKLFGPSQILKKDEEVQVLGYSTAWADGKPVNTQVSSCPIMANVQPLSSHDLLIVPEGDRTREQLWFWMDNRQFTRQEGMEVKALPRVQLNNTILRNGIRYQVQSVDNWGSYTRARGMREDTGEQQ